MPIDPRDAVSLDRAACRDVAALLEREWLVTNGIGGYAMGTLAGPPTRRYHGPLIAALQPPVGRTVLVGGLLERATVAGRRLTLHTLEAGDGRLVGGGRRRIASVRLDGMLPVVEFELAGIRLERRLWMTHGENTTFVRYAVVSGDAEVALEIEPLITARDHHALGAAPRPIVHAVGPARARVRLPGAPDLVAGASRGTFAAARGDREIALRHREETARGEDDRSTVRSIGVFRAVVGPDRPWTLVLSAEPDPDLDGEAALARALARQAGLLARAGAGSASAFLRQLVLAADQFVVHRAIARPDATAGATVDEGRTVIAGYPWFNDWGRDTMIALPGLTLATGRHEQATAILRSFAGFERDGLLPNDFPDRATDAPAYHTADAALWYVLAIRAYVGATGDAGLLDELLPTLRIILERHISGTRFGIGVDPADGLLRAGAEGYALTWMDARLDDWVVTPRRGKPVEIQALWVNALRIVGGWLRERGDADGAGTHYLRLGERAAASFRDRFWRPELGHLADVVDGPAGDDLSLRPNQLLAVSLPHPLVDGAVARAVVEACGSALATPVGLRSLAPSEPAYRPRFQGDRRFRDAGYHQGAVWSWLSGAYAEALARVTGDPAAGLAVLAPFEAHLREGGLGSISEIFEPEPPRAPRGCPAQAWSVAEVLRAWRALGGG